MNKLVKQLSTIGVIIAILLSSVFYLSYQDYKYTFVREERINYLAEIAKKELSTSIYQSLKREAQTKIDKVAKDIRKELLEVYEFEPEQFREEYDELSEDSILTSTIQEVITSEEDRYFHIESEANDIFVMSKHGIISDRSHGTGTYEGLRTCSSEPSRHFNQSLAKKAVSAVVNDSSPDIFWRFKNTSYGKGIGLKEMDIDKVLNLPLEDMKDYEFLTVSYIDKYNDILGIDSVSVSGKSQDSRRLMVVQGFSLYEHIQKEFRDSYTKLDKNTKIQLGIIEENRRLVATKLFFTMALIFISFFSIAIFQNSFVKGNDSNGRK